MPNLHSTELCLSLCSHVVVLSVLVCLKSRSILAKYQAEGQIALSLDEDEETTSSEKEENDEHEDNKDAEQK